MFAAAPSEEYADPEFVHLEYCKAAISTQQSALSSYKTQKLAAETTKEPWAANQREARE